MSRIHHASILTLTLNTTIHVAHNVTCHTIVGVAKGKAPQGKAKCGVQVTNIHLKVAV